MVVRSQVESKLVGRARNVILNLLRLSGLSISNFQSFLPVPLPDFCKSEFLLAAKFRDLIPCHSTANILCPGLEVKSGAPSNSSPKCLPVG